MDEPPVTVGVTGLVGEGGIVDGALVVMGAVGRVVNGWSIAGVAVGCP